MWQLLRVLGPLSLVCGCAGLMVGCVIDVPLDDKRCDEAHRCESGFVCRDRVCVPPTDAGATDAGATDAGREPDAGGLTDAGASDAGARDAGAVDAGVVDAGVRDAGVTDAGAADAGAQDAGPGEVLFTDDDESAFGLGDTTLGAQWSADKQALALAPAQASGVFTSRVFTAPRDGALTTVRWTPLAPYNKPLPSDVRDSAEAAAYATGGADLSGLVFLLHADEATPGIPLVADDALVDSHDANAPHPTSLVDLPPTADTTFAPGVWASGVAVERDDYFRLTDSDTHPDFAFSDGVFTFAGWVKIPGCAASDDNVILLGGEDPHIWFGAQCDSGRAHFQVRDDDNVGGGAVGDTTFIVDDEWHHLTAVKRTSPEQSEIFLDGELVATHTDDWATFSNFTKELFIGEFPIGTGPDQYAYSSTLTFDELAVFDRDVSAEDARAFYLRGVRDLRLQVRACPTAACTGVPFTGPDGTPVTFFGEPRRDAPPTPPGDALVPTPLAGRHFQYRVFLETAPGADSPAVSGVELLIALD